MKTSRRGFFGIFAGAAVGGKKAIAAAASSLTSEIDALKVGGGYKSGQPMPYDPDDEEIGVKLAPQALRMIGIPDWLKEDWREESREVYSLDPDLAACKSFSLSAKINLQRDRNYAKQEGEFWARGEKQVARKAWKKLYGRIGWW